MTEDEYRRQKRKKSRHEYYLKRREAALAYQMEYNATHAEQHRAYMREYRQRRKLTKKKTEE